MIIGTIKKVIKFCVQVVFNFVYEIWCHDLDLFHREMMSEVVHEMCARFWVLVSVMKMVEGPIFFTCFNFS